MDLVLKIRGIYATALTRFFLDRGFKVALPSKLLVERFAGQKGFDVFQAPDVEVMDLESKQGILAQGEAEALEELLSRMRHGFYDAVSRWKGKDGMEIEFPFESKSRLDGMRNGVVPTLRLHHRLKIIASDQVDHVEENNLVHAPEKQEFLSLDMERELIWSQYQRGKEMAIEHVKLDGRVLNLSEGEIVEADFPRRRLVLRRSKFKGRSTYDGLGIPKREGDYAVSEMSEGAWHYRHTYFRAGGATIGSYCNINTPVEFYPDRIRYVDLEIDVVQFPDGKVEVIDEGELSRVFAKGYLSAKMKDKAISEATRLQHVKV